MVNWVLTLDRILDAAADNFRIAKILIQMGLGPDNITLAAGLPARALVDLISSVQTVEIRAQ
jgi:hypothetical protein